MDTSEYYDTRKQYTADQFRIVERDFLRNYFSLLRQAGLEPRIVSGFFLHDSGGVEPLSALDWDRQTFEGAAFEDYVLKCVKGISDADFGERARVVLEVVSNAPALN